MVLLERKKEGEREESGGWRRCAILIAGNHGTVTVSLCQAICLALFLSL